MVHDKERTMAYRYWCVVLLVYISLSEAKQPTISGNRCPSEPFISGDGFRSLANHVYDETDASLQASEVQLGDIVFVKGDMMEAFFQNIHPLIQYPYILIVHNSDADCPGPFEIYLQDEKIIKWFGQNPTVKHHDKFSAIPIGIANRYISTHGNCDNFKYFWPKRTAKKCLLGYNFYEGTYRAERKPLLQMLAKCDYAQAIFAGRHFDYLEKMSQSKCIISPRGNGLDCHRTWEALIVRTIPIVKTSCLDELFDGLPVLIVDDWDNINQDLLNHSYSALKNKFNKNNLAKVTYAYWQHRILTCQTEFRAAHQKD